MTRAPSRRIFVLLLGFLLALAASLSLAQAGEMTVQMAMATDMSGGDCGGCGGGEDGGMPAACAAACLAPLLAVLPRTPSMAMAPVQDVPPVDYATADGRAYAPSLRPPRFPPLA